MGGRPPAANAGEVWCYVRIPAVTKTVQERVCVQPATCRQEWVPPVTQQVQEQVCVKPEEVRNIPIPAEYEDRCKQVLVCPGRTEWKRVNCEPSSLNQGEQLSQLIACLDDLTGEGAVHHPAKGSQLRITPRPYHACYRLHGSQVHRAA